MCKSDVQPRLPQHLSDMTANGKINRRRVWEKHDTELQARQTQASKDALRRKLKEKKSRKVKRHVLFKQKQHLLQDLAQQAAPKPIISEELGRPGGDSDDEPYRARADNLTLSARNHATESISGDANIDGGKSLPKNSVAWKKNATNRESAGIEKGDDMELKATGKSTATDHLKGKNDEDNPNDAQKELGNQVSEQQDEMNASKAGRRGWSQRGQRGKYVPFAKQIREYEAWKKQREEEQKQHQENIKKRKEMLRASKQKRRQRVRVHFDYVLDQHRCVYHVHDL